MKLFSIAIFSLLALTANAHHQIKPQTCRANSPGALIKEVTIAYRVGASQHLAGIDLVSVKDGKKFLDHDDYVTDPATENEGRIESYQYDSDHYRVSFRLSAESGELSLELNQDDEGVGMFSYLNTDGVRQASFFRCEPYPFE